jgi:hypothetical protein
MNLVIKFYKEKKTKKFINLIKSNPNINVTKANFIYYYTDNYNL